jgi:hypothetical protein
MIIISLFLLEPKKMKAIKKLISVFLSHQFHYAPFMAIPDFERRAIIATGEVQAQLGCPVSFHPGRHPEAPFEIIRLFQEAGGAVKKTVMSHLDSELLFM